MVVEPPALLERVFLENIGILLAPSHMRFCVLRARFLFSANSRLALPIGESLLHAFALALLALVVAIFWCGRGLCVLKVEPVIPVYDG